MHKHHHIENETGQKRDLLLTVFLNLFITVVQIAGGIFSNSLSLISDAFHNLSDGMAILIAYFAKVVSGKRADERKTFGYKRIEILAALLNAIILVIVCFFIIREAISRFNSPEEVNSLPMIIVAVFGLIGNLIAVILLKKHSSQSLNIRAAYIHLLGDTFSSVAVIAAGIIIYFFEIYWIDPLISVLICLYILRITYSILKETVEILMQSTPRGIDINNIIEDILQDDKIEGIHHVHVWKLTDHQIHFEGHLDLKNDTLLSRTEEIHHNIEQLLQTKYNIHHITLQLEFNFCDDKQLVAQHPHSSKQKSNHNDL